MICRSVCYVPAGVLINAVMPNWLITVLLVMVLAWLTYKTVLKGMQLHQSERQTDNSSSAAVSSDAASSTDSDPPSVSKPAAETSGGNHGVDATCIVHVSTSLPNGRQADTTVHLMDHDERVQQQDELQMNQYTLSGQDEVRGQAEHQQPFHMRMCVPWKMIQFAELTLLWSAFLALQYGKTSYSQCSWQFGLLCTAQGVFSLCATAGFIYQSHALRASVHNPLQDPLLGDKKQIVSHHDWPMLVLVRCVGITLLGGTVAGMLGFGGGMILNPLMLEMGIHPLVSSATSSVMVLFSASTATFAFAAGDRLNYQYAMVYGGVCAVASIFGVAIISTSVRRSGRGSVVVFILGMIIGAGALLQAVFGGIAVVEDVKSGRHLSFHSWC